MKSIKFFAGTAALFLLAVSGIAAEVIAQWDFQKPGVLKGSYPLTLRGKSLVGKGGLWIPVGDKKERAGAATVKKQPEVGKQFRLIVEFTISGKQKHTQSNLVLLDNKYVPQSKNPNHHYGFMLYLRRAKGENMYIPTAAFGYQNESVTVSGIARKILPDQRYTLTLKYDAGQVIFFINGVNVGSAKTPTKAIAPAKLPLHFGDRAGADYWPLGGTIHLVKFEKPNSPKTLPAGTVIGRWDFTNSAVLKGKYGLKLRGDARLTEKGLAVLNSDTKKPSGAILNGRFPELTTAKAFDLTAKIVLDGTFQRNRNWAMIFDAKYVTIPSSEAQKRYNKGFAFILMPQGNNVYRLGAAFGYGDKSVLPVSRNVTLTPGVEYTLTLRFSAAGKVAFLVNGKVLSSANIQPGSIVAPEVNITFGDRVGATYYPLGGVLKSVELRSAEFTPQEFVAAPGKRLVFERGEKKSLIWVDFLNFIDTELQKITVNAVNAGVRMAPVFISQAAGKSSVALQFPVDTTLLPGKYHLDLTAIDPAGKKIASKRIEYVIVPAYGDFMPVMLWGNYDDVKDIRKAGFTHQLVHLFPRSGNFDPETLKRWIPHLDENLKEKLYTFGTLHAHFRFLAAKRHLRTGKDGKVYPRANLEASHPEVQKEFAEAAFSTVKAVGEHPAFDGVLINSEVRDGSLPSFGSGVEPAAFKKFAGYDIPETVSGKTPKPYAGDPGFPWDRVIPDNYKDLHFLRWFWDVGDGWNPLQSLLSKSMHRAISPERQNRFFTFYDPVTRVPPMWGSGGDVDMISQWTYAYPDPIKIGQATDEVIAMAQGKPGQKIASMTQAIWYRSQTAPAGQTVKNPPKWLEWEKDAMFISVAPDSLREAFWSKISRRLDAIMYHGVGSLLARTDHKLYRMTNYESREVLAELCRNVVEPLGPVLKKVPERPVEVAILHSLAASFYAPKHFPMGWSKGWAADLHLALQWGHFQPAILFDEHLLSERNIEKLKVLFVPGMEVVTESVLVKLNQLRQRGVIIIGDEFTTPALMVDLRIKSVVRNTLDPAETKKELQKLGAELSSLLETYAPRPAVASNQDLVVRQRGNDRADYVFVVNDKRTFGDYVGQWKMVQEKGLANAGSVYVKHPAAAAYDLVAHKEIALKKNGSNCQFDVALAPGDGKVVLLLDKSIAAVELALPERVACGKEFTLNCRVSDKEGKAIAAYIPIELKITTSDGKVLPGSGFYAAVNGEFKLKEVMASNAPAGVAKVTLFCLASGKSVSKTMQIVK